jgi:hypothetical protein
MALSGLVILAAGITLGVAGTPACGQASRPRPPDMDNAGVATLTRFPNELNLSNEQGEKIATILREHFQQLEALRREARPKIEQLLGEMKTQVSAVLTEQQQADWQKLTARLENEFRRGMRRGPGGPGGPGRPGDGPRGGRGDWPRRPERFGPGEEGRRGDRPQARRSRSKRQTLDRRPRPDANDAPPAPDRRGAQAVGGASRIQQPAVNSRTRERNVQGFSRGCKPWEKPLSLDRIGHRSG